MIALVETLQQNPIEYQGEKVVTLSLIDQLHGRPDGTAKRNFSEHRDKHLKSGTHYHEVPYLVWSQGLFESTNFVPSSSEGHGGFRGPLILITERGYLLLVKSFKDDLAWKIQDTLVECYFSVREGDYYGASIEAQRHEAHLMEVFARAIGPYFGDVNNRIDTLETKFDNFTVEFKDMKQVIGSRRRNIPDKTKARHVEAMIARDRRRCLCCEEVEVIDEHGHLTPIAEWDHFWSRSETSVDKVWLVCRTCNSSLRNQHFKEQSRLKFDAYQRSRQEYEKKKQREIEKERCPLFNGLLN